ncbi:glycoside hydrolase family 3 C-terminal domain-containing protein [Trametes maxima]|nr:glycoside hydrolase family 3 C-terminal domain-containing protein [Trametes maxima]
MTARPPPKFMLTASPVQNSTSAYGGFRQTFSGMAYVFGTVTTPPVELAHGERKPKHIELQHICDGPLPAAKPDDAVAAVHGPVADGALPVGSAYASRESPEELAGEAVEAVRNFWEGWILEPLHGSVVCEIRAAGTVLLKNIGDALPLRKPRSFAIIGNGSSPCLRGPNGYPDHGGDNGTLAMGWGSGTAQSPYLLSPLEAIHARTAPATALDQDVALVFVNVQPGEGTQARSSRPVVVHSVEPWIVGPNVTTVLWTSFPGRESGNAIVDVLYGGVNPAGRLPYAIVRRCEDYGTHLVMGGTGGEILRIDFTEALNIDCHHLGTNNIAPRFQSGFGLSCTTTSYSNLHTQPVASTPPSCLRSRLGNLMLASPPDSFSDHHRLTSVDARAPCTCHRPFGNAYKALESRQRQHHPLALPLPHAHVREALQHARRLPGARGEVQVQLRDLRAGTRPALHI